MRHDGGAAERMASSSYRGHCGERLVFRVSLRRRRFDPRPICDGQSASGTDLYLSTSASSVRIIPPVLNINLAVDSFVK